MTWLEQVKPGGGAVLLEAFPAEVAHVACSRCPRAGRYRIGNLIARFGPRAALPDVLRTLSADCPRRDATGQFGDPCGCHFPQLGITGRAPPAPRR